MRFSSAHDSTLVISTCAGVDINHWRWTSKILEKRLPGDSFLVIGRCGDLPELKFRSSDGWQVANEDLYMAGLPGFELSRLKALAGPRFGWYAQQFAKLGAIFVEKDFDNYLIWDSDSIPTKRLDFIDRSGRVGLYCSAENHRPYFDQINKFLGYEKFVRESFIAQSFFVKREWVVEFEKKLVAAHGVNWGEALLLSIDFSETYGFSEFETLGTFISHEFPQQFYFRAGNWTRNGSLYFGDRRLLGCFPVANRYWDFVSFEDWQESWLAKLLARGRALK